MRSSSLVLYDSLGNVWTEFIWWYPCFFILFPVTFSVSGSWETLRRLLIFIFSFRFSNCVRCWIRASLIISEMVPPRYLLVLFRLSNFKLSSAGWSMRDIRGVFICVAYDFFSYDYDYVLLFSALNNYSTIVTFFIYTCLLLSNRFCLRMCSGWLMTVFVLDFVSWVLPSLLSYEN